MHSRWVYQIDRVAVGVTVSVMENEFANSIVDWIPVGVAVAVVEDEFANSTVDRVAAHVVIAIEKRKEFANSIVIPIPCCPPASVDRDQNITIRFETGVGQRCFALGCRLQNLIRAIIKKTNTRKIWIKPC